MRRTAFTADIKMHKIYVNHWARRAGQVSFFSAAYPFAVLFPAAGSIPARAATRLHGCGTSVQVYNLPPVKADGAFATASASVILVGLLMRNTAPAGANKNKKRRCHRTAAPQSLTKEIHL